MNAHENPIRNRTALAQAQVEQTGWPLRLGISIGFAGFLAFMAQLSFPLPWTPVPFSMAPFALLVLGAYQKPQWAALSVVIYLAAGALGLGVYADGEAGWHHLIGYTAGYLFGYIALATFVSWYVSQRRRVLSTNWLITVASLVGALVIAGLFAIVRFNGSSTGFEALDSEMVGWSANDSILWILGFVAVASLALGMTAFLQGRGRGHEAANFFLICLAGTAILHVMGVTGMILIVGADVWTAIVLGSLVFLPFDVLKAGMAVAVSIPFLPGRPVDDSAALPDLPET